MLENFIYYEDVYGEYTPFEAQNQRIAYHIN